MAILTEKTRIKNERNTYINKRFKELFKGKNQKQAIYELISAELKDLGLKCCVSTVQKVVNNR